MRRESRCAFASWRNVPCSSLYPAPTRGIASEMTHSSTNEIAKLLQKALPTIPHHTKFNISIYQYIDSHSTPPLVTKTKKKTKTKTKKYAADQVYHSRDLRCRALMQRICFFGRERDEYLDGYEFLSRHELDDQWDSIRRQL